MAESLEGLRRLAEWSARLRSPALTQQPLSVRKLCPGRVERPDLRGEGQKCQEVLLRGDVGRKDRSGVGQLNLELQRTRGRGDLAPLGHEAPDQVEVSLATHGRFDE